MSRDTPGDRGHTVDCMATRPIEGEIVERGTPGTDVALPTNTPASLATLVREWLAAVTGTPPSIHTLRAYCTDIDTWFGWCARADSPIDPLAARRADVDLYAKWLSITPTERTGRPPAKATLARKIACVASFYKFLFEEGHIEAVPVRKKVRPVIPNISTTRGLSREEATAILGRLELESSTDRAMVQLLIEQGLRVSEMASLNVCSIRVNGGFHTITAHGKGDKTRELKLTAGTTASLYQMLDERATAGGLESREQLDPDSPLFVTTGGGRYTQRTVMRVMQRIARAAGIAEFSHISPHVARHACATLMLAAGVGIHVVRDQLGHTSTSTTERYDRARNALARSGVDKLADFLKGKPRVD